MANLTTFLGFVARVALDRLTGSSERTEEGVKILQEWTGITDLSTLKSGIAAARQAAADPAVLRAALDRAAAETGKTLTAAERDALEISVVSGLSSAPDTAQTATEALQSLKKELLSGRGSYILWLDLPEVVGESGDGHYVHFSYSGESYRVRDYLTGNQFYPAGQSGVTDPDKAWNLLPLPLRAAQVWSAGRAPIRCSKENGLYLPVTEKENWQQKLRLLSEVAARFRSPAT